MYEEVFKIGCPSFYHKYELTQQILGAGEFGKVIKAKRIYQSGRQNTIASLDQETDQFVAVKAIAKKRLYQDLIYLIKDEIKVLSTVDHPNIIKYYESYENENYIYLVMEYFEGIQLFNKISILFHQRKLFTEREAAKIMEKLLRAIAHCHEIGICHRDIKPENIMINSKGEIKIIDFGLAKQKNRDIRTFKTKVGSPNYMAPEVISSDQYDFKCDIWSLGVTLYVMISGFVPFGGETSQETLKQVVRAIYDFNLPVFDKSSPECLDFIRIMLFYYPHNRPSAYEALQHKWFRKVLKEEESEKYKIIDQDVFIKLQEFKNMHALRKSALNVFVKLLNNNDIQNIQDQFLALDKSQCGFITKIELYQIIKDLKLDLDQEQTNQILEGIDFHENGKINYTEFLSAQIYLPNYMTEQRLWTLFKFFDVQDKNYLTIDDILKTIDQIGFKISRDEIEDVLYAFDENNEDQISYELFKVIMLGDISNKSLGNMITEAFVRQVQQQTNLDDEDECQINIPQERNKRLDRKHKLR